MTVYVNCNSRVCNDCGKLTSVNLDFCQHCGSVVVKVQVSIPTPLQVRELIAA